MVRVGSGVSKMPGYYRSTSIKVMGRHVSDNFNLAMHYRGMRMDTTAELCYGMAVGALWMMQAMSLISMGQYNAVITAYRDRFWEPRNMV